MPRLLEFMAAAVTSGRSVSPYAVSLQKVA